MKKLRSFCILALAWIMLCSLIACNSPEITTTTADPQKPEEPAPEGQISLSELASLQIVYPMKQGDAYPTSANRIKAAIEAKYGITVQVIPDGYGKEATCEILLGVCPTRAQSAGSTLSRKDDYACSINGKKILLAAGSPEAWTVLTDRFISAVIDRGDHKLFFDGATQAFSLQAQYAADSMLLGNADLLDSVIVYARVASNMELELAELIASQILDASGYTVPVVKETAQHDAAYEIHVGRTQKASAALTDTLVDDEYRIAQTSFGAMIISDTPYGYYCATEAVREMLAKKNAADQKLEISLDAPIVGIPDAERLTVMSFNVHYVDPAYGKINPDRVPNVIATILRAKPDVLGLQEVTTEWKDYLIQHLGDEYAFIGEGRDGGSNGEYSAIMYRKNNFELLESDTLWLSDTPNVVSKYGESSLNRILTYVKLKRISDGQIFVHINTHFDHKSQVARNKQAQVLVSVARRFEGLPVFMTGDFNDRSDSDMYETITGGGYRDSAKVAYQATEAPTAPGGKIVIDFCFVTTKYVLVENYYVDTTKYGEDDPSDHCPVVAEIIFK